MALFDWDTQTVTVDGIVTNIDPDNPIHVMLAEAARQYDNATDQMKRAARGLARAAAEIADRADESVNPMAGMGYDQMVMDLTKAQAKREALSQQIGTVTYFAQKQA